MQRGGFILGFNSISPIRVGGLGITFLTLSIAFTLAPLSINNSTTSKGAFDAQAACSGVLPF